MHKEGHAGSMLLAFAPFAFVLTYTGHYAAVAAGFLLLGGMPMVPDIDMKLPIKHRGWTHTVWFATALGVVLTLAVVAVQFYTGYIPPYDRAIGPALFAFFVGNMWVYGHLIGDAVTKMGIEPFYPFSDYWLRIDRPPFLPTTAASDLANKLFLIGGTVIFFASVGLGIYLSRGGLPSP